MGFDVSALTAYVDQSSEELLLRSQLEAKTASLATKQTGVKGTAALQLFATDAVLQNGASCGFNSSGTTTFSQRQLVTGAVKVQEALCPRDLEGKWTQIMLRPGQNYDSNPEVVARAYMEDKMASLHTTLENADWQGTVATTFYDGLLAIIDGATGVVDGNTGNVAAATGITISNVFAIVRDFILATPSAVKAKPDFRIFMGMDIFDLLTLALIQNNNFHYSTGGGEVGAGNYSLIFPGSSIRIEGVPGLISTNRIIGIRLSNMFLGIDGEGDADELRTWYSQDDDLVKESIRFRRGWQIAYPNEVVKFTLA